MRAIASLLLCLLSALVKVQSQTAPYLTILGNNIPNHGYVDLNIVGIGFSINNVQSLQCHTDLPSCCSSSQGPNRGDWYFPNGNRLQFSGNVYEVRSDQGVHLFYKGSGGTSGIYRCDIETIAVKDNDGRETVYVGLYTSGGDVTIPGGIKFNEDSDFNGESPQFTFNCTSIGGPVTTVIWTRDSQTVSGGMTVLDDPVTAQYTHTLTLTERLEGQYQCTVANNKPSNATAQFTLQDFTIGFEQTMYSVQEDVGSVEVCAVNRSMELPISTLVVQVSTVNGSAIAPNDYSSKREIISIQLGFMRECISVNISNDNVSERVEYFNLILTSEESRLTLNPNIITVFIHDDDILCEPDCQNGGNCTRPGVCDCLQEWSGNQCETAECVPVSQNGGTCLIPGVCLCPQGWGGDRCEKAECFPACVNGGTCTRPGVCQCHQGWSGIRCNKAVCEPDCQNGGTCRRPDVCDCLQGWSGNQCETAECFPACVNGGTCTRPGVCQCPQGWSGIRCNKALCESECQNGGVCTERDVCHCCSGWHGDRCQIAFTIGFVKDAYCVNESAGVVPIEVALHAGELRGNQYIIVKLILADGSSSSGEDYEPLSKRLVFNKNDTKHAVNVSIINDNIIDHNETLFAHLTLLSPLDESDTIRLSPNVTKVEIKDNDTVTIGFTSTYYSARIGMTKVLLNISVLNGVISRSITLSVSTRDIIPISVRSYVPLVNATVIIHPSKTTTGVLVTILNEVSLQVFTAHLSLVSPLSDRITVEPALVPVYIIRL